GSGTRALAVYEERWSAPRGPLCVHLHAVGDPGNVGAVLRAALAFGAASVALGPGCADPFGPRAVRASMGAIFSVPVARVDGAAGESAVAAAGSAAELEELRIRLLGRKAELPQLLRGVRDLPAEERGPVGKAANEARAALEGLIAERSAQIDADELDARLREDRVDVTLPGDPVQPIGRLHLITQ